MRLKRSILRRIFLVVFIWGAVAACGFSFYFKVPGTWWERLLPLPEGERIPVLVEPGMNGRQIAMAFEEQGALDGTSAKLLHWMIRFGLDRRMQAGYYHVVRSAPWYLARQLRGMRPALLKMTLLPGTDIFSLRESLREISSGDARSASSPEDKDKNKNEDEVLREALMDDANYPQNMRGKLPGDEESRIAFLMPETYLVVERTPQELVRTASSAWWSRWAGAVDALSSRDVQEAAVVASMVEREVLHDSECGTVAGVIHNRLRSQMPLQIDATVVYAWRLRGRRLTRVLNRDLTIDSPYNTYRVPGLPPHPICVPGTAAWEAALSPESNDFYYYVAGKNGYHYFATTYNEHLRNVKKARAKP